MAQTAYNAPVAYNAPIRYDGITVDTPTDAPLAGAPAPGIYTPPPYARTATIRHRTHVNGRIRGVKRLHPNPDEDLLVIAGVL